MGNVIRKHKTVIKLNQARLLAVAATAMLAIILIGFIIVQAVAPDAGGTINSGSYMDFSSGWKLASTGEEVVAPSTTVPSENGSFTITKKLPDDLKGSNCLAAYVTHQCVEVRVGGQLRYSLQTSDLLIAYKLLVARNVFVPLYEEDAGAVVEITMSSGMDFYSHYLGDIYLGEKTAIAYHLLSTNMVSLICAFVLTVVSAVLLIVAFAMRSVFGKSPLLYYLSAFVLCIACWMIGESKVKDFYSQNLSFCYLMMFMGLGVGLVFANLFFNELFKGKYRRFYMAAGYSTLAYYLVTTILNVNAIVDYMVTLKGIHVLMGIMALGTIFFLFRERKQADNGNLILFSFFLFVLLLAFEIIVMYANFLTTRGIFTTVAIWQFVAALAYISVTRIMSDYIETKNKAERLTMQTISTLASAIDAKDRYTSGHSERVAKYSREIAKRLGMTKEEQQDVYLTAILHDIGKIGVPDTIINKPDKLNDEEFAIIKTHPRVGYDILQNISELPLIATGARYHHERYGGHGYPDGISGEQIPIEARIIGVADAYDAMTSNRSYRKYLPQEVVKAELIKQSGDQFDPQIAEIMVKIMDEDKEYMLHE